MNFRFPLAIALALVATSAWAQKPAERSPLEIGEDYVESISQIGPNTFISDVDGTPRALSQVNYSVRPDSPQAMAEQYLSDHAPALRISSLSDLEYRSTRSGLAGHNVRFRQTVDGVPVWVPETVINIDNQNRVQFVLNEFRSDVSVPSVIPVVGASAARQAAFDHLGVSGDLFTDETTLIVYPTQDEALLAWSIRVVPGSPIGDWEAIIDATTGEFIRVKDHTVYHRGDDKGDNKKDGEDPPAMIPTAESHRTNSRVDGTGWIFDPDPLTRAGATYGDPGYVDNNDADSPELTAARSMVTLPDITFDGVDYHLDGLYAVIADFESPFFGLFEQPSDTWDFTRSASAFEAVNVFWQLDNYMRYINETLGIPLTPRQYPGGVQFDPHGLNGADNSHYTGGRVAFGEGCVDDSEDADVIIHELGHGIHDWIAGGVSNSDGLSEGIGDYVAVSYTRSLGLLTPADPEYNWVFKWDGHNPCWPGRITNYSATYPTGSAPHQRGQHWSTSNLKIWDDLGREPTDTAMFEGLAMTNSSTSQPVAAQAVLQAAFNMGYSDADVTTMHTHYVTQGYDVTNPVPVELLSFDAVIEEGDVHLQWATASETNNAGFEVQMARAGDDWRVLGFVDGHGTTTEAQLYRYTATNLISGVRYSFRLKQIDFDGAFEYSHEIEVDLGIPGTHTLSAAYPNPFNPTSTFTFFVAREQYVTVALFDAVGRQVQTIYTGPMRAGESREFVIDAQGLASGYYVYRAIGDGFSASRSIVLAK